MSDVVLWGAVGLVGGLGALARVAVDSLVSSRTGGRLPYGTLAVNVSGAGALGLLIGAAVSGDALLLAATGLLGSYTTFSTWMFETHRLAKDGAFAAAWLNVAASVAAGVAAVLAGRWLGGLV